MTKDELKLEDQICFSLYVATREITKRYRPILSQLNLTYPQYLVLLVLWQKGPVSVTELGQYLYLDSGTLTPMIKRMEGAGHLIRKRSTDDERKVYVELTAQGKKLEEKASDIPSRIDAQSNLEPEELVELQKLLNKMLQLPK